jgi:hypothetical protein
MSTPANPEVSLYAKLVFGDRARSSPGRNVPAANPRRPDAASQPPPAGDDESTANPESETP